VHQGNRAVRIHSGFLENNALFFLDILLRKEDSGRDRSGRHRHGQMLIEHLVLKADHFLGVNASDCRRWNRRSGNILSRPVAGALEEHVFDKVRNAVLLDTLPARTARHPDPDRDGTHVRHRFRYDVDPVGQSRGKNVAVR